MSRFSFRRWGKGSNRAAPRKSRSGSSRAGLNRWRRIAFEPLEERAMLSTTFSFPFNSDSIGAVKQINSFATALAGLMGAAQPLVHFEVKPEAPTFEGEISGTVNDDGSKNVEVDIGVSESVTITGGVHVGSDQIAGAGATIKLTVGVDVDANAYYCMGKWYYGCIDAGVSGEAKGSLFAGLLGYQVSMYVDGYVETSNVQCNDTSGQVTGIVTGGGEIGVEETFLSQSTHRAPEPMDLGSYGPLPFSVDLSQFSAMAPGAVPVMGAAVAGAPQGSANSAGTVSPAATATQLVVTTQPPSTVTAGQTFGLIVKAEDSTGAVDTSYSGKVTIAPDSNEPQTLDGTATVTAKNGIATFTGLSLEQALPNYWDSNQEVLNVSATGLTATTSTKPFTVTVAPATQFMLVAQSDSGYTSVTAGTPLDVWVYAVDQYAKFTPFQSFDPFPYLDMSFKGTVTVSDANGSGDLQGTTTLAAQSGIAYFSGLTLSHTGIYTLNATSPDGITAGEAWPASDQGPLTITSAAASQLAVASLGAGVATGQSFTLQVTARDPDGNLDPTFKGSVSLSLGANPGGAMLGGKLTATAVSGVATFSGLSISQPGSGYTLQASSTGLGTGIGPAFDVANDRLVVTTQPPGSVTAGSGFGLVVKAENGKGAVDSTFNGSVTVVDPSWGQTLGGNTTVTATKGVATFSGLTIGQAGFITWLSAQSSGRPAVNSSYFSVVPGTASQLAVSAAPKNATIGAPFEVDVAVEDGEGNVQTSFKGNVTIALANNPGGAALGGTHTVAVVHGVAAFPGLTLNQTDSGYTLQATATGLTSVTTAAINVTPVGTATHLVVTAEPPCSMSADGSCALAVTAEDGFGTKDPGFASDVTLGCPSGGKLDGTLTEAAIKGVATFPDVRDAQAGSGVTLLAASTGLDPATTSALSVTPATATQLVIWGPAGNVLPGSPFGMMVFAEDKYGNVDPSVGGNITVSLASQGNAALSGTQTVAAIDGAAFFAGLSINPGTNAAGTSYTLQASGAGLPAATAAFQITQDQLAVTSQPPATVTPGGGFGLSVAAQNASGIVDTSFTGNVTVTLIDLTGAGATLGGTFSEPATAGVANFSGLTLDKLAPYLLSVTASGVGATVTNPVIVAVNTGPLPTVSSVTPSSGSLAGGTSVVIAGTNLSGVTAVDFGKGNPAASFSYDSQTQEITAKSPPGTGTVNVTVTTLGGTSATSAADDFTYVAGPTISNVVVTATNSAAKTTISWSETDSAGLGKATLTIGIVSEKLSEKTSGKTAATFTYSAQLPFATSYSYTITALDANGISSTATGTFSVAATEPTISSVKTKATTAAKNSTISWKVADVDGVGPVTLAIDGGTPVAITGSGSSTSKSYTYSGLLPAGSHPYVIVAADGIDGSVTTSASGTLVVNATVPVISKVKVTVGTPTTATLIAWNAADIDGIASATVTINGGSPVTVAPSGTPGSYSYSSILAAGTYSYVITVTGAAGNTSKTASGSFKVVAAKAVAAVPTAGLGPTVDADWLTDDGLGASGSSTCYEDRVDAVLAAY